MRTRFIFLGICIHDFSKNSFINNGTNVGIKTILWSVIASSFIRQLIVTASSKPIWKAKFLGFFKNFSR